LHTYAANSLVASVADATPIASFFTSTGITESVTYLETDTFSDPGGNHTPRYWTIYWGDNTATRYQQDHVVFTHEYDSAPSDPIRAVVSTDYGDYTATTTASITPPTISMTGGTGVAYEHNQVADHFVVSRDSDFADPGHSNLVIRTSAPRSL